MRGLFGRSKLRALNVQMLRPCGLRPSAGGAVLLRWILVCGLAAACGGPRPGAEDGSNGNADGGDGDSGPATDGGEDVAASDGGNDGATAQTPPRAEVVTPANGAGAISLAYTLFDGESDTISVVIEWSEDGQSTWKNTAAAAGSSRTGLTSTPAGAAHAFVWASKTDVANRLASVHLRVRPFDGTFAGEAAATGAFTIDNRDVIPTTGVRITEVHAGPPSWIEITNTSGETVQLSGWSLRADDGGTPFSIQMNELTMTAARRLVVTEENGEDDAQTLHLGSSIGWHSAYRGSAALVDGAGHGVDFVRWEGSETAAPDGTAFSDPAPLWLAHDGASLTRVGGVDTNRAEDFCQAPATRGAADAQCYAAPPAGAALRIAEIFVAQSGDDQFVELTNTGTPSVDLAGWAITSPTASWPLGSATLVAGARATADAGSVPWAWEPHKRGAASLRDPTGRPHDFVRWGGYEQYLPPPNIAWTETDGPIYAPGDATSLVRRPEEPTSVAPGAWCIGRASRGEAGAGCIPGAVGSGLRINELDFATLDPRFELYNTSEAALWLGDFHVLWTTADGQFDGAGFVPGDVSAAAGGRPVFTDCVTGSSPGVCLGILSWGRSPSGSLEIVDNTGRSVDFVRWGGATALPGGGGLWTDGVYPLPQAAAGDAFGRLDWESDTNTANDWCKQNPTPGEPNGICE